MDLHKIDTDRQVFFYEQDFYILSNFSSFEVEWSGFTFKTSEHLYHWMRFTLSEAHGADFIAQQVKNAKSAHDAFKIAQLNKDSQVANWNDMKCGFMKRILHAKADQHEYVSRKLLATGDRELIEDSWRDDFWGWGPNRDGQNALGKLWMEVRNELRSSVAGLTQPYSMVSGSAGPRTFCRVWPPAAPGWQRFAADRVRSEFSELVLVFFVLQ